MTYTTCLTRMMARLAVVAAMTPGFCPSAVSQTNANALRADDPAIADGSPKMWALATDAIHSSSRDAGLDRLRWGPATKENIEYVKKDLAEGPWCISNRVDVIRKLKATQTSGYTAMFWKMGAELAKASERDRAALRVELRDSPNALNQLEIASVNYPRLKQKGLLAWDLARYIALCRRAYTAGYLEREEAWSMIMPVAQRLQTVFDSWEDLGDNYLLGRRFWSKAAADSGNPILENEFRRLLNDETSIWRKVPWNLDLGTGSQTHAATP
jgi:hypothetical protein